MSDDILSLTAAELVEHYRQRRLSPVEVVRAALQRIAALNPIYNAFVLVDEARALKDARESEARWMRGAPAGLVDGVPATVKDLIVTQGWPTLRGSRTIDPKQEWNEDGPPVARMREQGAVFLGKTTTPEFGWKGVTDSPLTGVTLNPWDARLTPGGSSGGAAVAAAFGMGVLHIATDGGGSIRIPAGFCGLFGFKPTFGIVPVHPHSPALTLWHQGPISRTVADAALMLTVIARPDPRDWYQAPALDIDYRKDPDAGVRGRLRIAYSRALGYARVDPEVAMLVERGVRVFESLGAIVEEIDLALQDPISIMRPLWSVALAMAVAPMTPEQRALVDPPLLELAEPGMRLSALEYRQLERERETFARRMCMLHQTHDLLITPQLAVTAFEAGHEVPPGSGCKRWWEWSPFTYPFNLSQQPAATVPCGFTRAGLPVAMQLIGNKFSDAVVLHAARAFEAVQPFVMPKIDAAPNSQQLAAASSVHIR
ncbi:MAG TPA: amidase [Burkholderiales bacterium]|jgi:aspartyl-tRNA(Asn)/glutamyl-tRNA(Gln) amidotransferase subunit A|nr:amidase [Burkholderiales bacterium]